MQFNQVYIIFLGLKRPEMRENDFLFFYFCHSDIKINTIFDMYFKTFNLNKDIQIFGIFCVYIQIRSEL